MTFASKTRRCIALAAVVFALGACSNGSDGSANKANDKAKALNQVQKISQLVPDTVAKRGKLIVGTRDDSPPNEFKNADGHLVGWEIDLIKQVGNILGLKVQFKLTSFDSLIPGLQANRYDLAFGNMGVSTEREKIVDFVTTLQANESFAALKKNDLTIRTLDDLCGLEVAVARGSKEVTFARQQSRECTQRGDKAIGIHVYQSANEAYLAVRSDRDDVFWIGSTNAGYLVQQTKQRMEIVGHYLKPTPMGIAFPKDSKLVEAVHKAVNHLLSTPNYENILQRWGVQEGAIKSSRINPKIESAD